MLRVRGENGNTCALDFMEVCTMMARLLLAGYGPTAVPGLCLQVGDGRDQVLSQPLSGLAWHSTIWSPLSSKMEALIIL